MGLVRLIGFGLLTLGISGNVHASDDDDDLAWSPEAGWFEKPGDVMSVARVDRPITLARRHYGLDFGLDYTRLSPVTGMVGFRGSGAYGISNDLEVGVHLLTWTFSSDPRSGLSSPRAFVRYRILKGVFQLGGYLESGFPLEQSFNVRLESRLRLGHFAAIDIAPELRGAFGRSNEFFPTLTAPLDLTIQILPTLSIAAGARFVADNPDLRARTALFIRGGLYYTFPDRFGAFSDAGLVFTSPRILLSGEEEPDPALGNYYTLALDLKFFVFQPPDFGRMGF